MALSQSGQTPDVLEYVERPGTVARSRSRSQTSRTRRSPAAPRCAPAARGGARARGRGDEDVHEQVAALALLAGRAGRGPEVVDGLRRTADLLELVPALERRVSELAVALAFVGRMFVIGRGPEFATARDLAEAARDVPHRRPS